MRVEGKLVELEVASPRTTIVDTMAKKNLMRPISYVELKVAPQKASEENEHRREEAAKPYHEIFTGDASLGRKIEPVFWVNFGVDGNERQEYQTYREGNDECNGETFTHLAFQNGTHVSEQVSQKFGHTVLLRCGGFLSVRYTIYK